MPLRPFREKIKSLMEMFYCGNGRITVNDNLNREDDSEDDARPSWKRLSSAMCVCCRPMTKMVTHTHTHDTYIYTYIPAAVLRDKIHIFSHLTDTHEVVI